MNLTDMEAFAIPLAQSAGLAEIEARWRYELIMQSEARSGFGLGRMRAFVDLQRRRLQFEEFGSQLEQFAPRIEPLQRHSALIAAADAYRSAGDVESEMRIFSAIRQSTEPATSSETLPVAIDAPAQRTCQRARPGIPGDKRPLIT